MPDLVSTAGCKFDIGGVKNANIADFTESDFLTGITWVEVDGWETMGDHGDSAEEIVTPLINRGRTVKQKGTFDAGSMENNFAWTPGDPGQIAMIAANKTRLEYAFRIRYSDVAAVKSSTFTVTIAAPGVVTWTAHGLPTGTAVQLTTTGALPTGLTVATTYFVTSTGANTFTLSATKGGAAITTSGTQSGVHTVTTQPAPSVAYFTGKVMGSPKAGGDANAVMMLNATVSINSNIVDVTALG
jgi:hypothetical protein